jgi:hypothetical protein
MIQARLFRQARKQTVFLISLCQIYGLDTTPMRRKKAKMKKLLVVLPLAILLVALTISWAGAGMDYEDPKLCVEGKWLLVIVADPSAITVSLPEDVRYGNQQQGRCSTPGPNAPLITQVNARGHGSQMRVQVDGARATPTVTVSYGADTQVRKNNGHSTLNFNFRVDD